MPGWNWTHNFGGASLLQVGDEDSVAVVLVLTLDDHDSEAACALLKKFCQEIITLEKRNR